MKQAKLSQGLKIYDLPYLPGTRIPADFEIKRELDNTDLVVMSYNANGLEFNAKSYSSVPYRFICQVVYPW